jgi:catechol 2,3-dioxygenase-like lactoylglutathione lyase family enzyme
MEKMIAMTHGVFSTPNIIRTSEFYEKVMGFKSVQYLNDKEPHICLYRDSTEIILTNSNGQELIPKRKSYGHWYDAYFITDNQKKLQEELRTAGANIVLQLFHTEYNHQEFVVEDVDGRWICFGIKEDMFKSLPL